MKLFLPFLAAALALSGCTSVRIARNMNGALADNGREAAFTVEVENSGWFLFSFLPLASGNIARPNESFACSWFENTVNVQNNLKVLESVLAKEKVSEAANLTSRRSNQAYLFFLLQRRACHTSAVVLKNGN